MRDDVSAASNLFSNTFCVRRPFENHCCRYTINVSRTAIIYTGCHRGLFSAVRVRAIIDFTGFFASHGENFIQFRIRSVAVVTINPKTFLSTYNARTAVVRKEGPNFREKSRLINHAANGFIGYARNLKTILQSRR